MLRFWKLAGVAVVCAAVAGCSTWGSTASEGDLSYTVAAEKLRIPWAIAFSGDTVFISERQGKVVRVEADGTMIRKPVKVNKAIAAEGEGGFLGFTLAPDFLQSGQAYAYHTYEEAGAVLNRVVLLQEEEQAWSEVQPLIEGIPGSRIHNGGRLAIGPDGHLYITTGDGGEEPLSQDPTNLAGKILRATLTGAVPADNPFPDSYVYSYGHRNPQGITWDEQGVMYSSEHGPSGRPGGHDELNVIKPGLNYGWPEIIGDAKKEGMVTPIYHTGDTAIAPSGMTMDEQGGILVAALRGEGLYRYDIASGEIQRLLEGEGRVRDVAIHDGVTYVITNNTDGRGTPSEKDDRLLRVKQ